MIRLLVTTLLFTLAACAPGGEPSDPGSATPPAKTVDTLAGTGVSGSAGDGGPGDEAQVGNPFGVVIGPDDALYICEVDTHRVRRLDLKTNVISTVVGSGRKGYSGDGGPALEADLNEPYEIRFAANGDMYFVEMRNSIVRKVDAATGTISTVAGTGEAGYSGDGGPAVEARLHDPHSIELDGQGSLYIADIGNHRVRQVDLATGVISTLAGTGEQAPTPDGATLEGTPLNGPRAIAFDPDGDMLLALPRRQRCLPHCNEREDPAPHRGNRRNRIHRRRRARQASLAFRAQGYFRRSRWRRLYCRYGKPYHPPDRSGERCN